MNLDEARDAFYEAQRTDLLPLAVNDVVTVREGIKCEARAWVISIESLPPEARYLVEYDDGSEEIVALAHLHRE